ncbi:hypothetical protein CRG98_015383 [Punica granatum]|uniref:Uncharacterized protein n=1 Tax=Punica granatum TaxID=22663 RepID=A0A2I0K900_PUNGR|nr:hypothetical protein CRG98_015383 [Punica granatum]
MSSRVFLLLGLLAAIVLLLASDTAARDLAETTSTEKNDANRVDDANDPFGYGGGGGGRGGGGRGGGGGGDGDRGQAPELRQTEVLDLKIISPYTDVVRELAMYTRLAILPIASNG